MRAHVAVVTHMENRPIRAPTEAAGEGEDLVNVHCITFKYQMALLMSYIYTLDTTKVIKVADSNMRSNSMAVTMFHADGYHGNIGNFSRPLSQQIYRAITLLLIKSVLTHSCIGGAESKR